MPRGGVLREANWPQEQVASLDIARWRFNLHLSLTTRDGYQAQLLRRLLCYDFSW